MRQTLILFLLALSTLTNAQSRNTPLTITVSGIAGDNLEGQEVELMQTDYQAAYGNVKLNAQGTCTLNVYAGNHRLTINRSGFETATKEFVVTENVPAEVSVTLVEKTRNPFALNTSLVHDAYSGKNSIEMSWNVEPPVFFDDFESYEPFAIQFGEWTGIDGDDEFTAPLLGSYPNRGVKQYAQIINPLTVIPTWWYDYPILRPYSGNQYAGFIRTNPGNANDDWLISPVITPGIDNVLQFMVKAADRFTERFQVYVTTKTDNPQASDFVRIDQGNYETADYDGWKEHTYNLSEYSGQPIRFAIRYISHYNMWGSFMLMLDDVFVGQKKLETTAAAKVRAARVPMKSPANPNELFHIYLDETEVGTTYDYSYIIENVPAGNHNVGVKATYVEAQSDLVSTAVNVPGADSYAKVTFSVTADSKLTPDGQVISLVNTATTDSYQLTIADGKASIASLPKGTYVVNVAEGAFEEFQNSYTITADDDINIVLRDNIINPYNITVTTDETGKNTLQWNQELGFIDSFEDYDDFATGEFGEWITLDNDHQPVYPIALGDASNIVSFPGSGTATNPTAIAPMVFNPWHTVPAMLPTDEAIKAPTGDKTVIFFSAQRAQSDKWLISPLIDIHDNYEFTVLAKAYAAYPESMEFCISEGSTNPADFILMSEANPLEAGQWARYSVPLDDYAGQQVRLGIHYTSYDAFLTQIDDFTVGVKDGGAEFVDYGNIIRFDIYIDGVLAGYTETPSFILPELSAEKHTIGIKAIYKSGESETTEYVLDLTQSGISQIEEKGEKSEERALFNLNGQRVSKGYRGIVINKGNKFVITK